MSNHEKEMLGKLLVFVCRLHGTKADRFFEQLGLYRGQAFLLRVLSKKDGLTHSEIAEILEISPAAATKVIKRMEQSHFIVRKPDKKDERVSRVFIQEAGMAIVNRADDLFVQLNQIMFEGFSEEDLIKFHELLMLIKNNLIKSEPNSKKELI